MKTILEALHYANILLSQLIPCNGCLHPLQFFYQHYGSRLSLSSLEMFWDFPGSQTIPKFMLHCYLATKNIT